MPMVKQISTFLTSIIFSACVLSTPTYAAAVEFPLSITTSLDVVVVDTQVEILTGTLDNLVCGDELFDVLIQTTNSCVLVTKANTVNEADIGYIRVHAMNGDIAGRVVIEMSDESGNTETTEILLSEKGATTTSTLPEDEFDSADNSLISTDIAVQQSTDEPAQNPITPINTAESPVEVLTTPQSLPNETTGAITPVKALEVKEAENQEPLVDIRSNHEKTDLTSLSFVQYLAIIALFILGFLGYWIVVRFNNKQYE